MAHFTQWRTFCKNFWEPCASRNLCYIWACLTQFPPGESQCFEESFARSMQCIMGLTKCKQTAVKTSNMAATWLFRLQKVMPFTYYSTVLLITCKNDRPIYSLSSTKKVKENFTRTQDIQHFVLDILASAILSIMNELLSNLHCLKSYI